jgi:hypothetical protein
MYTRDKYQYCNSKKCKKKTRWTRCPGCNGSGPKQMSTCSWRCSDGYWCEQGLKDRFH